MAITNPLVKKKKDDEDTLVSKITKQTQVPALKGMNNGGYSDKALGMLNNGTYGKQHMAERRAHEYQNRLAQEQKKYSYNEQAAKNNTLEKADKSFGIKSFGLESSDHDYLQRIFDRYGDSELTKRTLRESNQTKDWERKYGKSYDQIYSDFLADQGNVKMQMGEAHPFLTEVGTIANSIPTALQALPSLFTNLVDPENPSAQKYEEMRKKKSEENKYWRAGVKQNTGEKGDNAIDLLNSIADRMAVTTAGNKIAPGLGAVMAGLSEANQRLDDLDVRGVEGRQKYLTALGHGAVEGAGTALVGGWLDKIPGAKNLGGAAWNLVKGGAEGAAENALSEVAHNSLDTYINGERSEKELNKAIFMAQGMSEKDAEAMAQSEQGKKVARAALAGAGFGAGMRGLSELGNAFTNRANASAMQNEPETVYSYQPEEGAKLPMLNQNYIPTVETNNVEVPEAPTGRPLLRAPEAEAPKDHSIQTVSAEPRLKVLEGEELEQAKTRATEYKAELENLQEQIKAKKAEIDALPKTKKNYSKRNALYKELKNLQEKAKESEKGYRISSNQANGKAVAVKDLLDENDYRAIFDKKTGLDSDIGYATMFAGNTPDAKALAKDARNALSAYVENGSDADYNAFMEAIGALDDLARETNADYKTKVDTYRYNDFFGEDGLYGAIAQRTDVLQRAHDVAQSRYEIPKVGESAPVDIEEPKTIESTTAEEVSPIEEEISNRTPILQNQEETSTTEIPSSTQTNTNQGTYQIPKLKALEPEQGNDISQHYYTLKNSDMIQASEAKMKMLEEAKESGVFNKGVEGRLQAREEALKAYVENPELAKEKNMSKQWDSGKDIDTSMLIMHDALENGDQADFNLTALKQTEELKGAARVFRATRDYSGTREGTLVKGVEYLNDKADAVLKNKKTKSQFEGIADRIFNNGDYSGLSAIGMDEVNINNIREAIEAGASKDTIVKMLAMHKAVGATGISADAIRKINDIYNEIEARNLNPTSKERANLEADAYKVLAQDIGGKRTAREMWDSWRYLAMLGNPKTHIRNVLGNTTHYMVTEVKDSIGAVMEDAIDRANRAMGGEGIERTKSRLTGEDNNLVAKSAQDADDVAYAMLNDTGNKYNDIKGEINRARDSFNNKVLTKIDDLNSNLLDVEDYSALKRKYSKSLARFLKANGADESIFDATDDASKALLDKARVYAIDQAKQATFHEYSKLADQLTQFSKNMQEGNLANKAAGMAVEGLVPFKKTPINILKQAVKYSPVSLAKGVGKIIDSVRTGNSTASDAIEEFASGLTGTGIMALGYFLAHEGFLTGGQNEDWDVDNAESEQGKQNYALKIGNKSYTLDWLAPMSLPLFVGAELSTMFDDDDNEDADNVDKVISALSTIAEPVTEMSMLQGIQNVLNELSYSRENVLGTLMSNTTLGYASQGVPTLAGQIARAADPYRRSTYSDQPSGFKRQFDKTLQKTKNKLPFLSMLQEPYIDYKGNQQETQGLASSLLGNNFGTRLIDQMVSPGYYKEGNITPVDSELNRLYEQTGIDVYPNVASGKVNDERLSKENFTKYQKLYGKNTDNFYKEFINSAEYNSLDDQTKAETLDEIRYFARKIADLEVGGKQLEKKSDIELYDIYKKQGAKGVADYYKVKAKADSLGLKYDTYLKKEEEYEGGAEQYAAEKAVANQYDLDVDQYQKVLNNAGDQSERVLNDLPVLIGMDLPKSSYYTYANAVNVIPSLTPDEFYNTYESIDGADGSEQNGGIKQDEVIAFLNNNNVSEEEAMLIWQAYGDPTWKKIPYLKDGVWSKKSK